MRTTIYKSAASILMAGMLLVSSPAAFVFAATPPINTIHIGSSGANGAYAKVGDSINLSFITTSTSTTPTATIDGHTATITGTSGNWNAFYGPLQSSDPEGVVAFSIVEGSSTANTTTDSSSVTFDHTAPTVALSTGSPSPTGDNPIYVTATFSEPVTGFDATKLNIGDGAVSTFKAEAGGSVYDFGITPAAGGSVSVDLNGSVASDAAGNPNTAASQLQVIYSSSAATSTPPSWAVGTTTATSTSSGGGTTASSTPPAASSTPPTITFGVGSPTNGSSIGTSTVSFTFSADMDAALKCVFGGSPYTCGSPQTFVGLGDSAYVFTVVAATSTGTATSSINFTVDTIAPTISEVTPVPTPSDSTTPQYSFFSNEAGTVVAGGSCTMGSSTPITMGTSTITFAALNPGTYSNCTVAVEDAAGNQSNVLALTPFTINAPPVSSNTSSNGGGGGGGGGVIAGPLSIGYVNTNPTTGATTITPAPTPAPTQTTPPPPAPASANRSGTSNGGSVLGASTGPVIAQNTTGALTPNDTSSITPSTASSTTITTPTPTTPTNDQGAAAATSGGGIPAWGWAVLAVIVLIILGIWLYNSNRAV